VNPSLFFGGLLFVLVAIVVSVLGGPIGTLILAAIGVALVSGSWRNPKQH
jgi:hypothetical protein